jgi:chemotaxis-related protein WspB
MLYLLFQIGNERYALEASRVVEVVPLLNLKEIPQAPRGLAGIFNYRGRPVPAVDLCELAMGKPAGERLSTRIIVVGITADSGAKFLVGLIAERATETLKRSSRDFIETGVKVGQAPYLGPVLMDGTRAIQLLHEQKLLSEPVRKMLFSSFAALENERH